MGLNGDYSSMAEAVGEAPPRTGITGDEYAEILHDCGDDYEMAAYLVGEVDEVQTRDREAWEREHRAPTVEDASTDELVTELEQRGYFDGNV
jgi:hypothetical protein